MRVIDFSISVKGEGSGGGGGVEDELCFPLSSEDPLKKKSRSRRTSPKDNRKQNKPTLFGGTTENRTGRGSRGPEGKFTRSTTKAFTCLRGIWGNTEIRTVRGKNSLTGRELR